MALDEQFVDFLIRAKGNTYAGGGAESASSRPRSKDLHYQEGDCLYIDTFLGGIDFAGEEAVWMSGIPVWSMNYYGWMLVDQVPEGFSECLKGALKQPPHEAPFRGPHLYQSGRLAYQCQWEGSVDRFNGEEEILLDGKAVYRLVFHGGRIIE